LYICELKKHRNGITTKKIRRLTIQIVDSRKRKDKKVLQNVFTNSAGNPESELIEASGIDWNNPPCSPKELSSQWKETTHPAKIENTNDKEFTNTITQEVIEFHPRNTQGENKPHWHRKNPSVTNRHDYYLDKDGNPVGKNSKDSHIYTNC